MVVLWAIAKKMIQESFRRRSPILMGFILIVIISSFPFILQSDDTLRGKLQITITYSMTLTFVSLCVLTLFLGVSSFTGEIKQKQIYLVETKAVYRWQFFWGKFIGLAILNFVFLSVMGLAIWILIMYLIPAEKEQSVYRDILTTYRGANPYVDLNSLNAKVNKEYLKIKRENRLPQGFSEAEIKERIKGKMLQGQNSLSYKSWKNWVFRDLPASLKEKTGKKLKLRYKLYTSKTPPEGCCKVVWLDNRNRPVFRGMVNVGEFAEFSIPVSIIANDNSVELRFVHMDPETGDIIFPIKDGLELLSPTDSFHANYLRGMFLIYMILCFLSLVALFSSTFLTFPVAILFAFYIMFIAMIANFLGNFVPEGTQILLQDQRNIWYYISKKALRIVFLIIPNLDEYNPTKNLALGRMVEWKLVMQSVLELLLMRGCVLLGGLGCIIFHYRELGRPLE